MGAVVSMVERAGAATPHSIYEQFGGSHRADGPTWNAAGSWNTSPLPKLNDSSQQPGRMADTLHWDATLILLCYRHGLRVSELVALKWSQVELKAARLHVKRAKGSIDGVHPLTGRELRALRKLQREQPAAEHLFMSERGSPMAPVAAQKVVRQAGERAGFGFPIHIHMLRHSCGYALINQGTDVRTLQAWLGHASIANTVIYTRLDASRFNSMWRD